MALVFPEHFQHMRRLLKNDLPGNEKIMYSLTRIKGVGRRFANLCLKRVDIDMSKRAGELTDEEEERLMTVLKNPQQFKIPKYFLNRQRNRKDNKYMQLLSNDLNTSLREDIVRLKKIRAHRGVRHHWGLRVRGQHTKTTGRRGRTVGVSKKKGL